MGSSREAGVSGEGFEQHRINNSFSDGGRTGVQPDIKSIVSSRHDVSRHETRCAPMTIMYGDQVVTRDFGQISWRQNEYPYNMLSTHPELAQDLMDRGPAALDLSQSTSIVMLDLPRTENPNPRHVDGAYQIDVDAQQGLITLHSGKEVTVAAVADAGYPQWDMSGPRSTYSKLDTNYLHVPMNFLDKTAYKQLPALREAFTALGVSRSAAHQTKTIPTPSEYVRRMEELRLTETASGLYYPKIRLFPAGRIDPLDYLQSYADGEFPVGSHTFGHYDHDTLDDHILSVTTHGDMLMDTLSTYAQVEIAAGGGKKATDAAAGVIDGHTDSLGNRGLDIGRREEDIYNPLFERVVGTLRAANRLEDLQLVQWMRGKGVHRDEEISGQTFLTGLLIHTRAKFEKQLV